MKHTIVVDFTVREGALAVFMDLICANAAASLKQEPGCERFDVLLPRGEQNRVLLYEIYRDAAAFDLHRKTAHFHAFDAASAPLVLTKQVTTLQLVDPPLSLASGPARAQSPSVTPPSQTRDQRVTADTLRDLATEIFVAAGAPRQEAHLVADVLVEADLRGMQSHGVLRIPTYVEKIRAGGFKTGGKGRIIRETPSTVLLDGENGLGQVITIHAMQLAMEKAKATGIGAAGVLNSNHFGEASYYVLRAAEQDMVAIVATNGSPNMPAWGGTTKMTGPLPFTAAVPTRDQSPFVIDAALGMTNRGKLIYMAERGDRIPLGWGVDRLGQPTEDPKAVLDGGWILPIGGHKGFGITMFLEILSGVLTGANVGSAIFDLYGAPRNVPQGLGHFCVAIDPAAFMAIDDFKSRMDAMIRMVKASHLAPGFERMTIPGEPEVECKTHRQRDGIPLSAGVVGQLNALAAELGCQLRI